jgi:hypothetical protein
VLTASADKTARIWRIFPTPRDLVDDAKRVVPRCLSRDQKAFLDAEPRVWCIKMEKYPYDTQAWKDWLKYKRANANPPLADTKEWQPWLAARTSGTTMPAPGAK